MTTTADRPDLIGMTVGEAAEAVWATGTHTIHRILNPDRPMPGNEPTMHPERRWCVVWLDPVEDLCCRHTYDNWNADCPTDCRTDACDENSGICAEINQARVVKVEWR